MKSIYSYLTTIFVAISFSACVPPGTGTDQKGGASSGFGGFQFIFLGLMILVFWMFFIRPQAKRAKEQKNFHTNLQRGDRVVTTAGIHGTINKINDDGTMNLEVSPGSYLKVEKSAVHLEMTKALNKPGTPEKK